MTHILGVEETALEIARRFAIDGERLRVAALAHDLDRDLPAFRTIALARDWRVGLERWERRNPVMAHGPLSAARLRLQYGCDDPEVLAAVRHHTLGHRSLGVLGLALFVADYCEPNRAHLSTADRERILAHRSLEQMTRAVIEHSAARHPDRAPPTQELYEQLRGGIDG